MVFHRETKRRLERSQVKILDEEIELVRCQICNTEWKLERTPDGQLVRGYTKCPSCYVKSTTPTRHVQTVRKRKISELTKAPTNIRKEYPDETMATLRASIATIGMLHYPICTPNGEVIMGWGRVQAASEEGFEEIYVTEIDSMSTKEQLLASFSENYARADNSDDEEAEGLLRLREEGMTVSEIARITGMNIGTIYSTLSRFKTGDSEPTTGEPIQSITKIITEEEQEAMRQENLLRQVLKSRTQHTNFSMSLPSDLYNKYVKRAKTENKTVIEIIDETLQAHEALMSLFGINEESNKN